MAEAAKLNDQWQTLLDLAAASQSQIDTSRKRSLQLTSPRSVLQRNIPRQLAKIEPELAAMFRRLAAGKDRWPLFLHGRPGTGKTSAALAFADLVPGAAYATAERAADWIIESKGRWEWVQDAPLAILDELGARERIGDLHYAAVKRFADLRDHRPAIFISNVHPNDIAGMYDDRVASRLLCGSWYELGGKDRRFS